MSHLQERKEKVCLNCGAELIDRYCQKCGQENVEPKENFLHLTKHFLEDITHFDGKFFSTIKYLILKPGFLTEEYIKGRRASYINPIRLYLFISALFFLLLMSFFLGSDEKHVTEAKQARIDSITVHSKKAAQSFAAALEDEDTTVVLDTTFKGAITVNGVPVYADSNITIAGSKNFLPQQTVAAYDSAQNSLKEKDRDGWFKHHYKRKLIAAREASHNSSENWVHGLKERIMHSIPYMLFLSLPLIALLLKLLYIRRRKQFFYVSHIIFLLHFYCLVFIALIVVYTLRKIGGGVADTIAVVVSIGYYIYLYAAMKRFYKQGWFKTFIKYLLLIFNGVIILFILMLLFVVNSFLNSGGI